MPYHMRLMHTMPSTFTCRSHFTVILRFNFLKAFIVHKDMNDIDVESFYVETTSCTWFLVCTVHVCSPANIQTKERHGDEQGELGFASTLRASQALHNRSSEEISGRASGRKAARLPASAGLPCGNMSCIHTHIHTSCMGQPASCQDKTNPEMRVYTVFREIKDTSPLAADTYVKLIEAPASQCPLPENCPKSTNSNHPKP